MNTTPEENADIAFLAFKEMFPEGSGEFMTTWINGYCAALRDGEYSGLSERQKKMTAFALFTLSMKLGPESFTEIENIIHKIGINKEFEDYAKSWINYKQEK